MEELKIRKFKESEEEELSKVIKENFLDAKDSLKEENKNLISSYTEDKILNIAKNSHIYVAVLQNKIVGFGAIASFLNKEEESMLLPIFVLPEFQKRGIGKKIMDALEEDEYYIRARRIEVKASNNSYGFYKKMGFHHKYNLKELDKDGNYKLEKFRYRLQYDQNYHSIK